MTKKAATLGLGPGPRLAVTEGAGPERMACPNEVGTPWRGYDAAVFRRSRKPDGRVRSDLLPAPYKRDERQNLVVVAEVEVWLAPGP